MLSFRQYFNEDYYYHGTSESNANHIKQNGIDPAKSKYNNKIFLTKNHGEAFKYAKIANNGKPGVVFRVHKNNISTDNVEHDNSGIIQYTGKIDKEHINQV